VLAAIDALALYRGHRVLLLGDLAELGSAGGTAYQEVADYARRAGIDELWTLGEASRQSADRFGDRAQHFVSKREAIERARDILEPGVTLLLKGSRSAGVDEVVSALVVSN
jgi:UDP-N-acetylmuramoyl-tripeptide--D-alanyl-D-alanine ligase